MAQYTVFPTDATYIDIEDATGMKFRLYHSTAVRTLALLQTMNTTGFAGTIDEDYMVIEYYELPSLRGAQHRVGVRDAHFVIDQTYDPDVLGFGGDENIDWANIEKHQL